MKNILSKPLQNFANWNARNGLLILRLSLGIVFFWFGFLKFFPGLSEAEEIATKTMSFLTFNKIPPQTSMVILGILECVIGLLFVLHKWMPLTLFLLYFQMIGACIPLFIFSSETWTDTLFVPTLLGQYIIKNCVLISAGIVIGATIKGGALVANPNVKNLFNDNEMSIDGNSVKN